MAKLTLYNPAVTGGLATGKTADAQNISYDLPEEGKLFNYNAPGELAMRKGDKIYKLDTKEYYIKAGNKIWPEFGKYYQQYGGDMSAWPKGEIYNKMNQIRAQIGTEGSDKGLATVKAEAGAELGVNIDSIPTLSNNQGWDIAFGQGATTTSPDEFKQIQAQPNTGKFDEFDYRGGQLTNQSQGQTAAPTPGTVSAADIKNPTDAYGDWLKQQQTGSTETTQTLGTPPTGVSGGTTGKATDEDVKRLYQQYFNRQPSQAELDNWGMKGGSDTTVSALDNFLKQEQIKYGTGQVGQTGQTGSNLIQVTKNGQTMTIDPANLQTWLDAGWTQSSSTTQPPTNTTTTDTTSQAYTAQQLADKRNWTIQMLKSSGLPQSQVDLIMLTWDAMPADKQFNNDEIIKAFSKISSEVINPYYQNLMAQTTKDLEIDTANQNQDYTEAQKLTAEKAQLDIQAQQQNLEGSGLGRTGVGKQQLGAFSTFGKPEAQQALTETPSNLLTSQSTDLFSEGLIPKEAKRLAESTRTTYLRNLQSIGSQAEKQLGSSGYDWSKIPGYSQYGGVIGAIPWQQQQAQAGLLGNLQTQQQNIQNYQSLFA